MKAINAYLERSTSAAPLAVFRIILGSMIFCGVVRFWMKGWIESLYVHPDYFFSYYGFEFVRPLGNYTYLLFAACGIAALFVALGLFYRVSIVVLFSTFTYIELIDKSTYLNHYYFISMICLMMIVMPAHRYFSIDAIRNGNETDRIPAWCIDSIKLFVCIVYLFAGVAKINADWLLQAQPLRVWLPAKNDLPIVGPLLSKVWVAYFFSWAGCLYDLSIPFLLLYKRTRFVAFGLVVIFHVLTAILFPIGMFPYIMIGTAVIFLSPEFKRRARTQTLVFRPKPTAKHAALAFLALFFVIQLLVPFRYLLYPGKLGWTEEGYRFSWRVMLMEKAGYAQFKVMSSPDKFLIVDNNEFLTPLQEKMMSSQPDMILQYAHILRDHYSQNGFELPKVYVDSYVTINGHPGRVMIDPNVDLAGETESFAHKSWILPFEHAQDR